MTSELVEDIEETAAPRMRYLGEILIANGALSEAELDVALAQQMNAGGRLGEVLLRLNLVRATDLLKAVAEQNNVEFIDLDSVAMDPSALTRDSRVSDDGPIAEFVDNMITLAVSRAPPTSTSSPAPTPPGSASGSTVC